MNNAGSSDAGLDTSFDLSSNDILQFVIEVREYLEGLWPAPLDEDDAISKDQCGFSSAVLVSLLNEHFPADWVMVGGVEDVHFSLNVAELTSPVRPGGMLDKHGCWQDHYWVRSEQYSLLVDITADQFGHDEVTVTSLEDSRYYANWTLMAVRNHGFTSRRDVQDAIESFRSAYTFKSIAMG